MTGPRRFGLLGLSPPEAAIEVPITWQLAYGGQVKRPLRDEINPDGSVKKAAGSDQWHTDERNPVGVGLDKSSNQAGPQLEVMGQPYTDAIGQNEYPPMGLSAVGKAWLPCRRLAGTYDNTWLKDQWPLPPLDFDDQYWNCAPEDQQLEHLPPGAEIILLNLLAPGEAPLPSTGSADKPASPWQGKLPNHQLWIGVEAESGAETMWRDQKMKLDTLVIDMALQKIFATYRFTVIDGQNKGIRWRRLHTVLTSGLPDQPIKEEEWGLLR